MLQPHTVVRCTLGSHCRVWCIFSVLLGIPPGMASRRIRLWRRKISRRTWRVASMGLITSVDLTCRRAGLLHDRCSIYNAWKKETKKPAAFWAISGGCGFCCWLAKSDTGRLVADLNLRLQIVLQSKFSNQIQLRFEPIDMPFFFGQDLNHHVPTNIVMNAIGVSNGFA